ncbi:MAG: TIGR02266 family protein [Hyalangium sp.]|uniref:TIGR02266 family protein n=1 Tax=Hyalangium sp. TaxID=2028555 RepID=UPI00389A9F58
MANYWIGDTAGRVLGPLTLQALRELIGSGRLRAVSRASRDGNTWTPIQEFDEVKDLLGAAKPSPAADKQQAEQLRARMRELQALKTPNEVFGVKPGTSLDELRLAFFRMAKRFSPEHLAPDAAQELRRASQEMFDFLSQKMREAESHPVGTPVRGTPVVGRSTPAPVAGVRAVPPGSTAPFHPAAPMATPVRKQVAAPTYSSEEFVGLTLRHHNDQVHADIQVSEKNVGMFTDHRLINLSSGGIFIQTHRPLRLGTKVNLRLHFAQPARSIELKSAVIWEHALDDGRQPQGYGLGLAGLRPEEKNFLLEFIRVHAPKPAP